WYALHDVGRAARGERVLIHSAAGGTGLAAIQVARLLGLEVLATAGNEPKRNYLRNLGITHVMDSRSLSFVSEVQRATSGRGVDLVLSSVNRAAIEASLSVLAPYGRFLELGKRAIQLNTGLPFGALKDNISYTAIDLASLEAERPQQFASLFRE